MGGVRSYSSTLQCHVLFAALTSNRHVSPQGVYTCTGYVVSTVIFFARTSEVFNDQFMTSSPASVLP